MAAATVPEMCIPCCSRPCLVGEAHGRIAALACKWMSTSHEEHRCAQIHDGACCNLHGEVMHAQRRETADGIAAATPTTQQDNKTTSRQGETRSRFSVLLRPARTTSVPTLNADPLLRGTLRHPSSFPLETLLLLYTAACPPRERIRKARRLPSRPSCKAWRAARAKPERWPCQWIRRPGQNAMQTSFVGALRSWAALHGARRASRTASATSSACRDSNTQAVLNIIASPPLPSMPSRYHRLMNHLMNE